MFKKVKVNEKVYGVVFGNGTVRSVWENSYYAFEVEYETGDIVPYTIEGYPAWNNGEFQTVFYKSEIDLMNYDISTNQSETLDAKKIAKLKSKNKLEMKCPSGIWQNSNKCPGYVFRDYINSELFHLFRKDND